MKLQTMKRGFLGDDEELVFEQPYSSAKAIIILFGLEETVSYGGGTKNGPAAIIKASHQLNENDEQTGLAPYKAGLATLIASTIPARPQAALDLLADTVSQVINDKKFPIILGGEHSLTQGSLAGICRHYDNVTVLHFDAHSDLRTKYHGSVYSHASVMRESLKNLPIARIVQVGIRSVSDVGDEFGFMNREKKRLKIFWAWQKFTSQEILKAIPTKDVFISFDVDAFDPSIMPATGTPEPGGLLWWPILEILKAVFEKKNVVGADVVELAPIKNFHSPDFMIARLVYKMIGYKFAKSLKIKNPDVSQD